MASVTIYVVNDETGHTPQAGRMAAEVHVVQTNSNMLNNRMIASMVGLSEPFRVTVPDQVIY